MRLYYFNVTKKVRELRAVFTLHETPCDQEEMFKTIDTIKRSFFTEEMSDETRLRDHDIECLKKTLIFCNDTPLVKLMRKKGDLLRYAQSCFFQHGLIYELRKRNAVVGCVSGKTEGIKGFDL